MCLLDDLISIYGVKVFEMSSCTGNMRLWRKLKIGYKNAVNHTIIIMLELNLQATQRAIINIIIHLQLLW